MANKIMKAKLRTFSVEELATRQFEFEKQGKTVSDIRISTNGTGFGKSAMRAAGILTVGVAALAAGQQLTTGWNVMAMDVPAAWATTAVQDMTELRQIQQKAILSLETAHLSLEAAQQLESDSVTVLKDAKHLLAGITVVPDRAVNAQTFRDASIALEDYIYGPLAEKIASSNRVLFLLESQTENLQMLLSNQASLGLSPEQTLLQSNSYQAQIAKLEGLISVKSTEIARDENLRESFEIERSALSDASRLMQAIDQYESGEMPTDNHVLAIDNFQLTYYAPQIAELTHAGNEMVVMTKANFDMVKNLGERALEKAKNDPSQAEFLGDSQSQNNELAQLAPRPKF